MAIIEILFGDRTGLETSNLNVAFCCAIAERRTRIRTSIDSTTKDGRMGRHTEDFPDEPETENGGTLDPLHGAG
ncbi:MAG TPA: hypothetical protein VGZ01_01455, partial [Trinickia sp.]|nr:hypothetical protein [Trinickia sp.]